MIRVGGGEQASGPVDARGRHAPVIAGAVEPLMMEAGHRSEGSKKRGAGEHALSVIGVQPDPLPFVRRQRPRLLPYLDRDGDPPHVVDQGAASKCGNLAAIETK